MSELKPAVEESVEVFLIFLDFHPASSGYQANNLKREMLRVRQLIGATQLSDIIKEI